MELIEIITILFSVVIVLFTIIINIKKKRICGGSCSNCKGCEKIYPDIKKIKSELDDEK